MLLYSQTGFNIATEVAFDALAVPEPINAVEWAEKYFYLPSENSQIAGKWKTRPYQVAILNAMNNDAIQQVDVMKSSRIGYTKMLLITMAYNIVHRQRNIGMWQPTDGDVTDFDKEEIKPLIEHVPVLKARFPSAGKKSPDNTNTFKKFLGCILFLRGAVSAKNFRRIGVQIAMLDELEAFPHDVESEGSPSALAWKRTEGAAFRKMIRGSSPRIKEGSQIEAATLEAEANFFYHAPCPNCGHSQRLAFGGKDTEHGLKWIDDDPTTAAYQCISCKDFIKQREMLKVMARGLWVYEHREALENSEEMGPVQYRITTRDGENFYKNGKKITPPMHVAFNPWTILSPMVSWVQLVRDWLKTRGNPLELKTFINTTLGETFDISTGEKISKHAMMKRCEDFSTSPLPFGVCAITAGVDVQPDRFEVQHLGWAPGLETWVLKYTIIECDTSLQSNWDDLLDPVLMTEFETEDNISMIAECVGVDTGYNTQQAYKFCLKNQDRKYIALKGRQGELPIIPLKPKETWAKAPKGLKGWICGVDTAKTVLATMFAREKSKEEGATNEGYIHFPKTGLPDNYFDQVTSERRLMKINNKTGKRSYIWFKPQGRPNEALDNFVYGMAALEHLNLDLDARFAELYSPYDPETDPWAAFDEAIGDD